jgi:hypothetical protein
MSRAALRPRPASAVLLFGLCCTVACEDGAPRPSTARHDAPVESESPSAKIFPAPLQAKAPDESDGSSGPVVSTGSGGAAGRNVAKAILRKLPLVGPVEPEVVLDTEAAGYQLDLVAEWPPAQASVEVGSRTVRLLPQLSLHVLPETPRHAARLRVEFAGGTLPLPDGTEFVASSDAEGWLVVWPDHRSYRVVPSLALRSVLEERRVDRMPPLAVEVVALGVGRVLARETRRIQLSTVLGTVVLDMVDLPETGAAGTLACAFFLALLRAEPRPHCAEGSLPVAARYVWHSGQAFEIGAQRLLPRTDYRTADFALPPRLGIFKPGELPPQGAPSNLDVGAIWPEGRASTTWSIVNHHDVPMYLLIDGIPVTRLDPHLEQVLRLPPGEHRHAGRDWLGQVTEVGGVTSGYLPGATRVEATTRPTVQYGMPPELEAE